MARILLVLAGVSSMAAVVSGQCATTDNANCANWKRNGFCTNPGYAKSMLQQYCPYTCKEQSGCFPDPVVPGPGTATTAPKAEENANCAKWAADATTMFCASATITEKQKTDFCKTTCAAEIAKTEDCAIYLLDGTAIKREPATKSDAAVATKTNAAAPKAIAAIYARDKCTVKLIAEEAPADAAAAVALQSFTGSATAVTIKAEDAAKNALSYNCVCA